MTTLDCKIEAMERARAAFDDACAEVWSALGSTHPNECAPIKQLFTQDHLASTWTCRHFGNTGKSAAELIATGRSEEVMASLLKTAHGMF